jgi:glycosyltransferase involved in cell wall biosynthesis
MHVVLGAYLLSGTPGYRQAGVHQYAKRLLQSLSGFEDLSDLRLTALVSPAARNQVAVANYPVRLASRTTEQPFSRIFVEQVETPRMLRELRADLYHGLGFVAPLRAPCPTIVTVHDLSFVTQPRAHKWFNRTYLSLATARSCRRAARVIAVSVWTKRDVERRFSVAADKIDAIPHGVDHEHFKPLPPAEIAAFRAQHGIGDHAIFFLGSLEPRKNLPALIEAFSILDSRFSILDFQLFIGGSPGWKYDDIFKRIQSLGLGDRVKLLGRVSDEELPKWYGACAVFAYPSLYEGFGLPVLEAMACGAPVVTSNVTSLPEVVGDAGIMIEPTDAKALADALSRVLNDDALHATMRSKGIARAAQFTWRRTAEMTIESYRRVIGNW